MKKRWLVFAIICLIITGFLSPKAEAATDYAAVFLLMYHYKIKTGSKQRILRKIVKCEWRMISLLHSQLQAEKQ